MHEFLIYLVATANFFSLVHLGLYIVGANAYDILQLNRNRQKKLEEIEKNKAKARKGRQPLVSVIVPAHNEEVGIKRTLDSILASTYSNVEVIVVDDGSKDNTVKIVREYIKKLPHFQVATYMARYSRSSKLQRRYIHARVAGRHITLVSQTNQGKGAAVNNGISNHARGQFIMTLDADSLLHPKAIENAIAYFNDKRIVGVAANVRVMGGNNWLSLLQRFEHMIGYRSKKFYSLTGTEFIIGGVASTYRRSTLKQVGMYDTDTVTEDIGLSLKIIAKLGNRNKRIIYASDVVAMTEGVQSYRQLIRQRYRWKMGMLQNLYKYRTLLRNNQASLYSRGLTMYRLPVSIISELLLLLSPFILTYLIFVSISYKTLAILLGAYITITFYILWNVWPDEYLNVRQKIKMSVFALFMYIMFYAMDLVQIIAIIRCLKDFSKITLKKKTSVTWTSPTRSGKQTAIEA